MGPDQFEAFKCKIVTIILPISLNTCFGNSFKKSFIEMDSHCSRNVMLTIFFWIVSEMLHVEQAGVT